MASLTARDVADYLIASVDEDSGDNISNLKLQKLLYYAQGFSLAIHGEPLFDEPLVAWAHGPVVRHLARRAALAGHSREWDDFWGTYEDLLQDSGRRWVKVNRVFVRLSL